MNTVKYLSYGLAIVSASIIGLTGCGGGGGGSSLPSIVFPSDSVLAEPTLLNAQKVRDEVLGDPTDDIPVPILNSVSDSSKMNLELLSRNVSQKIIKDAKNNIETYSLNAVDEYTYDCAVNGTIDFYANGDDVNGGYVTLTYNNCDDGYEEIINGSVYMSISNLDSATGEFKDMLLTFTTDYTITTDDLTPILIAKIIKGTYLKINVSTFDMYGYPIIYKVSISMQVTDGIETHGIENAVFNYDETNYPESMEMYQTAGRIYINNLASYVEYDTTYDMSATPFLFLNGDLHSGEVHYIMAGNGKMKIIIEAAVVTTYVDADGDGVYETSDLPT